MADRSIVYTGDTGPSDALVELAQAYLDKIAANYEGSAELARDLERY